MNFPTSAQPQVNAPVAMTNAPNVQHGAPIQTKQSVATQHFGCAGCVPTVDAQFGADPSLTKTTWPLWMKIGIVLGVISLGLVVYHVTSK